MSKISHEIFSNYSCLTNPAMKDLINASSFAAVGMQMQSL